MPTLNYQIIDCDNHYYEPDDCYTRHIETQFRDRTVWVDRSRSDGLGRMMLGSERLNFFSTQPGDFVGPPGAMKAFFKGETDEGGFVNLKAPSVVECVDTFSRACEPHHTLPASTLTMNGPQQRHPVARGLPNEFARRSIVYRPLAPLVNA